MEFYSSKAKGHHLGGDSPTKASNIYMSERCNICEKYLEDDSQVLRAKSNEVTTVICVECAYNIHSVYESNF